MQTIADLQKFKHKAKEGADAPCFGALCSLTLAAMVPNPRAYGP